jgi:hypothetical protein
MMPDDAHQFLLWLGVLSKLLDLNLQIKQFAQHASKVWHGQAKTNVVAAIAMMASQAFAARPIDFSKETNFNATNYAPGYVSPLSPSVNVLAIRACIGEKVCPVPVASMFPCGYTEQAAANSLCTVYKPDGSTQILNHTIQHQGTHEGDHCGYDWFLVNCFTP